VKVIEGGFGKNSQDTESKKASEVFTELAQIAKDLEEEGIELEMASVLFSEGNLLNVIGNGRFPDSLYMLFHMGASIIMDLVLSGEGGATEDE